MKIVREARSSLSPDREPDSAQRVQETDGLAGVRSRQISKALGEQTPGAGRVGTEEPTYPQTQNDLVISAGQICHRSLRATMDTFGAGATLGTASRGSRGHQRYRESSRRAAQGRASELRW